MKISSNLQAGLLCSFIVSAVVTGSINKEHGMNSGRAIKHKELVRVKITGAGTVGIALSAAGYTNSKTNQHDLYAVRITLNSNKEIYRAALMQYLNFGIKKCITAVQDNNNLPCVLCERIPGINQNHFLYMTTFSKQLLDTGAGNLTITINDTVAGFGTTIFEIAGQAVRNMEAIKY